MINDSGNRTEFETGAVRDIQEGKGRFDLMPLDVMGVLFHDEVLNDLAKAKEYEDVSFLYSAIRDFSVIRYTGDIDLKDTNSAKCIAFMMLKVAKHFEEGAKKYGERNWEKGIPIERYLDSAVRHYMKWLAEWEDEPHDRAFVWNIMCCIWTIEHNKIPKEDPLDIY